MLSLGTDVHNNVPLFIDIFSGSPDKVYINSSPSTSSTDIIHAQLGLIKPLLSKLPLHDEVITGISFTGIIATGTSAIVVKSPSLTCTVNVAEPFQSEFGMIVTLLFIIETDKLLSVVDAE